MPKKERNQAEKIIMYLYYKYSDNSAGDIGRKIGWSKGRVNSVIDRNLGHGKNMIEQKKQCLSYYEEIKHLIP